MTLLGVNWLLSSATAAHPHRGGAGCTGSSSASSASTSPGASGRSWARPNSPIVTGLPARSPTPRRRCRWWPRCSVPSGWRPLPGLVSPAGSRLVPILLGVGLLVGFSPLRRRRIRALYCTVSPIASPDASCACPMRAWFAGTRRPVPPAVGAVLRHEHLLACRRSAARSTPPRRHPDLRHLRVVDRRLRHHRPARGPRRS